MRILLVEEKKALSLSLFREELGKHGFKVDLSGSCDYARAAMELVPYGAVILDFRLTGESGTAVLCQWRKTGIMVPVLVLTRTGDDVVDILNAGADDCIPEPMVMPELSARLRAMIRRCHAQAAPVLSHGDVTLDTGSRVTTRRGTVVKLTPSETVMLELFLLHKKRLIRKEYLHLHFSSWHQDVSSNVIEVHICHLRRKLGGAFIHTVHGLGYRLGEEPGYR